MYISPEKAGISPVNIQNFIESIEKPGLSTHNLIISRGDDIFFEKYWAPFTEDMTHRMYSVSKSIVAIAVGFAIDDGLVNLDDKICKYFPKECENAYEGTKNQTVRDMLMMSTAQKAQDWFAANTDDRVAFYFSNKSTATYRPSGTVFEYDSTGSFVLGAMVERVTGKKFMDYLREKLFSKIGVSEKARCLECPGGHSWGDSGVLCTPLDLWKIARFVMNKGRVGGEQLLDEGYITDACSKLIDNSDNGFRQMESCGYGYLIWHGYGESFFFNGMGCQFALCVPEKDLIMIYNGDNQGIPESKDIIFENFFRYIVNTAEDKPLGDDVKGNAELESYTKELELAKARGSEESPIEDEINGVLYELSENTMGISKLSVHFENGGGKLCYVNKTGAKELYFGMCENAFSLFPEEGYSKEIGSVTSPGNKYHCAASAAWIEPKKLFLKVQIIDDYFGRLNIILTFKGDEIGVYMNKSAENFLDEYSGYAMGKRND